MIELEHDAAYREAIDFFAAHQYSYGREAGGVQAACVAAALTPNASVASVIDSALRLARDGTKKAIVAALAVVAVELELRRRAEHPVRPLAAQLASEQQHLQFALGLFSIAHSGPLCAGLLGDLASRWR